MLGMRPRLPVSEEDRQWVDRGFDRLGKLLGRQRMLDAEVILPQEEYFPDPYDKTPVSVERMLGRICDYMQVDLARIKLEFFPDEIGELKELLPYGQSGHNGCAGLYVHPDNDEKMVVAIKESQVEDPFLLAAVLAHELGHVILLGDGLIDASEKDMEPMTDLLTVYLGFGVFNGTCAGRFQQWQKDGKQGWSMQRLGYLPEEVYGYALALFAHERGESRPEWAEHLSTNLRSYFKSSLRWIEDHQKRMAAPIN